MNARMSRRPAQASHTRDIARLHHLPATVLCVRHSSFPFGDFAPPPRLVTLHLHKSQGGYRPFTLNLLHFDTALRSMPDLSELELWEVEVLDSADDVPAISGSALRCVAIHGHARSVSALANYLRLCPLDVLVAELFQYEAVKTSTLNRLALSVSHSFTFKHDITSAGIFLKVNGTVKWHATIDLVLKSAQSTYITIRVPAARASVISIILSDCASASFDTRLSFDTTPGDDPGDMVRHIFSRFIPLTAFRSYHLHVEDRHVTTIFHALSTAFCGITRPNITLHGRQSLPPPLLRHGNQIGPIHFLSEERCRSTRPSRTGRWVKEDGREVFSPSVDVSHDHLMRMLSC